MTADGDGWTLLASDLAASVTDDSGNVLERYTDPAWLTATANVFAGVTGDAIFGCKLLSTLSGLDPADTNQVRRLWRETAGLWRQDPRSSDRMIAGTKLATATPDGPILYTVDGVRTLDGQAWVSHPPLSRDLRRQANRQLRRDVDPHLRPTLQAVVRYFCAVAGGSDGSADRFAVGLIRPNGDTARLDFSVSDVLRRRRDGLPVIPNLSDVFRCLADVSPDLGRDGPHLPPAS